MNTVSPEAQALVQPVRELLEKRTVCPCLEAVTLCIECQHKEEHGPWCDGCLPHKRLPDPRFAQLLHVVTLEALNPHGDMAQRLTWYIRVVRDWTGQPEGALGGAVVIGTQQAGVEFYDAFSARWTTTPYTGDYDLSIMSALKATLESEGVKL